MSMKTTTSGPLSVADIQRALRPRVYATKRTPSPAIPVSKRSELGLPTGATPGTSPAPALADMLDQARVHTAVLRTLLADAAGEEDAARTRLDDVQRRTGNLAPLLDRAQAATSAAKALNTAVDRASLVADRLARLIADGESLSDDLRTRQAAEFDRLLTAFSAALAEQSAAALAQHAQQIGASAGRPTRH